MSIVELVVLFILGLRPAWSPGYCDGVRGNQERCRQEQEEGYATAQLLAPIFVQEAESAGLGSTAPFWMASVAQKENSLSIGDRCIRTVPKEILASQEELEPSPAGERRVHLCVNLDGGRRQSCRNAIVLEETEEKIKINYCMAGEIGTFQLTRFEAAAGMVVPATGETLPTSYRERRERLMDPLVNTSLAAAAFARLRDDCCEEGDEECRNDWTSWIGAYNTGSCTGQRSYEYAGRISRYYEMGLKYMCSQAPESEFCPKAEEAEETDDTEGEVEAQETPTPIEPAS